MRIVWLLKLKRIKAHPCQRIGLLLNEEGFALILTIWILLAFGVTATTAFYLISRRANIFANQINSLKAVYLAESAKNIFLESVPSFEDDLSDNTNITKKLGGNNYSFTISYANKLQRSANMGFTGTAPGVSRSITMSIAEDEIKFPIISTFKKYNAVFLEPDPITIRHLCAARSGPCEQWGTCKVWGTCRVWGTTCIRWGTTCIRWGTTCIRWGTCKTYCPITDLVCCAERCASNDYACCAEFYTDLEHCAVALVCSECTKECLEWDQDCIWYCGGGVP